FLLFVLPLLAHRTRAQAPYDPAAKAAVIAPFFDEQTLAVGRVDLTKLDPLAAMKLVADAVPDEKLKSEPQFAAIGQQAQARLHVITQSGIRELYAIVSLADFPKEPLFVVAPVISGHDPQKAADALREAVHFPADVRPGLVILGPPPVLERLK